MSRGDQAFCGPSPSLKDEEVARGLAILRIGEVCRRCGLSRATIWRLERADRFPARRCLTGSLVGWLECEIDDWISSRAKRRTA